MRAASRLLGACASLLSSLLLLGSGCASDRDARATSRVTPETARAVLSNPGTTTRLSAFRGAELKAVTVADGARDRAQDELARRLDEQLRLELRPLWAQLTEVPRGVAFGPSAPGVVRIEPLIVESRLVRPLERDTLKWAMGESYVLVKVVFRDGATGESLAEPVFYRKADTFWASWSGGAADIQVERLIADDVVTYTRDNL